MEYIERDDPFYIAFKENSLKSVKDGYDTIFCVSNFYRHEHNSDDVMDMLINEWPKERVKGVITAMWTATIEKFRERNINAIELLGKAFEKYGY